MLPPTEEKFHVIFLFRSPPNGTLLLCLILHPGQVPVLHLSNAPGLPGHDAETPRRRAERTLASVCSSVFCGEKLSKPLNDLPHLFNQKETGSTVCVISRLHARPELRRSLLSPVSTAAGARGARAHRGAPGAPGPASGSAPSERFASQRF